MILLLFAVATRRQSAILTAGQSKDPEHLVCQRELVGQSSAGAPRGVELLGSWRHQLPAFGAVLRVRIVLPH
jgi:hypothetical protein